ncbi:MAG: type VI secretion system contractile sheath domain-containing protein [Candidatus Poribacteria bacterium]
MNEQSEIKSMPMKVLVASNFDGANSENPLHTKVTKDDITGLFSQLMPKIYIRVPNKLTSDPKELNIDLVFNSMESFHPKAIADQIELIKEAVQVRENLYKLIEKSVSIPEIKLAIADSKVARALTPDLIAVLDKEDIDQPILENAIKKFDSAISDQFDEILHNPKFQELESTWRGLTLMLENADFPDKVHFEILNVEKERFLAEFDDKIFQKEYDDVCEVPLSVILADYDFTQSPNDMALLKKMAEKSHILQVVFVSHLSTNFFGMRNILHLVALPNLYSRLVSPIQSEWKNFMQDQSSRWVCMTMNRFLGRNLYGQDNVSAEIFDYREKADAGHPDNYLWIRPLWLMGIVLARSFANSESCLSISGLGLGGEFIGLPTRDFPKSRTENIKISTETTLTDDKVWSFLHAGVTPLNGIENANLAYFPLSTNAYRAGGVTLHSTLAYHLFIGHVFHSYYRAHQQIPAGSSPDQITKFVQDKIFELIAPYGGNNPDETVIVNVTPVEGESNLYTVNIVVKPKLQIEAKDVEFTFQLQAQV